MNNFEQYKSGFEKTYTKLVYDLLKEKLFVSFGLELTATNIVFQGNSEFPLVGKTFAFYHPIEDAIYINIEDPFFVKSVSEQERYAKVLFILFHEAYHKTLMHVERKGTRDNDLWNIAVDFEVHNMLHLYAELASKNENMLQQYFVDIEKMLVKWNNKKYEPNINNGEFKGLYSEDLLDNIAEEIYAMILNSKKTSISRTMVNLLNMPNMANNKNQQNNGKPQQQQSGNRKNNQQSGNQNDQSNQDGNQSNQDGNKDGNQSGNQSGDQDGNQDGNQGGNKSGNKKSGKNKNNMPDCDKSTQNSSSCGQTGSRNNQNIGSNGQSTSSGSSGTGKHNNEKGSSSSDRDVNQNSNQNSNKNSNSNQNQNQQNQNQQNSSSNGNMVEVTETEYTLPNGVKYKQVSINWPKNNSMDKEEAKAKYENKELRKQLMEQNLIHEAGKQKGNISVKCEKFLKKLFKIKIDWEKILKASLQTILCKSCDFTWARPRSSIYSTMDIYLPDYGQNNEEYGTLIVARDESGSMSDEQVAKCGAIIADAKEHYKKIIILKHDTEIQYTGEFENLNDEAMKNLCTRVTCGGTSHKEVFKFINNYYKKHRFDEEAVSCVILMTDCCSDIQNYQNIVPTQVPMIYMVPEHDIKYTNGVEGKIIPIEI